MSAKAGLALAALLLSPVSSVSPVLGNPVGPSWKRGTPQPDPARVSEVKEVFRTAWDGYYKNAFPHDTLMPISGGASDDR